MDAKQQGLVKTYVKLLTENVDAYWSDRVTFEAFDRRAKQLWFCIEGGDGEVAEAVRIAVAPKVAA